MLEKIRTLCIHNMVHKHTTVQQLIMYCPIALTTPLGQVDSPRPDSSLQKITTDWNLQESTVQGPWDRNWKPSMGVGGGESILKQPVVRYPKNSSFTDLGIKWFKHPPLNQPATKHIPSLTKNMFSHLHTKVSPTTPGGRNKTHKRGWNSLHPFRKEGIPLPVPNYRISVGFKNSSEEAYRSSHRFLLKPGKFLPRYFSPSSARLFSPSGSDLAFALSRPVQPCLWRWKSSVAHQRSLESRQIAIDRVNKKSPTTD